MCRDIVDIVDRRDRLVVAARIERQLADQLALEVDHTDLLVGDQQLDADYERELGITGTSRWDGVSPPV